LQCLFWVGGVFPEIYSGEMAVARVSGHILVMEGSRLLQFSIPQKPVDPAHPFPGFGWPAILCGPIADYDYPPHTGPASVNFCFGGVLSLRGEGVEWCADSTRYCIAARREPTVVRTLSSRKAQQVAFFYTEAEVAAALAKREGEHPLEGEVAALVETVREAVRTGSADDAALEEWHALMAVLVAPGVEEAKAGRTGKEEVDALEAARRAIEADPVAPPPLEALAAAAGLSKYYFLRAFKQRFHRPPHQYALARKMERARTMLAAGECKVEEVSRALGYASWSNFARQFRQATGVTPKEYQMLPFAGARRKGGVSGKGREGRGKT